MTSKQHNTLASIIALNIQVEEWLRDDPENPCAQFLMECPLGVEEPSERMIVQAGIAHWRLHPLSEAERIQRGGLPNAVLRARLTVVALRLLEKMLDAQTDDSLLTELYDALQVAEVEVALTEADAAMRYPWLADRLHLPHAK